jgi:hypothetical protein
MGQASCQFGANTDDSSEVQNIRKGSKIEIKKCIKPDSNDYYNNSNHEKDDNLVNQNNKSMISKEYYMLNNSNCNLKSKRSLKSSTHLDEPNNSSNEKSSIASSSIRNLNKLNKYKQGIRKKSLDDELEEYSNKYLTYVEKKENNERIVTNQIVNKSTHRLISSMDSSTLNNIKGLNLKVWKSSILSLINEAEDVNKNNNKKEDLIDDELKSNVNKDKFN